MEESKKDPGFLVAKGKFLAGDQKSRDVLERDHKSKLSNAIFRSITNHGYATVRAVGSRAIANAVWAITTASARCQKQNTKLYWSTTFDKGNLGPLKDESHVVNVIALVFSVDHWDEIGENND